MTFRIIKSKLQQILNCFNITRYLKLELFYNMGTTLEHFNLLHSAIKKKVAITVTGHGDL
jgi:hypothetical protein